MATYRSSSSAQSSAASFAVPRPPGVMQGDVLVAFQTSGDLVPSTMLTPSGWTLLGQRTPVEDWGGARVWWKVAGADEPASYIFRQAGSESIVGIIAVSDADSSATPLISSVNEDGGSQVTCPAVTPSTESGVTIRYVAALHFFHPVSWTPPANHTERMDRSEDFLPTAALATRARSSSGSTGAASFGASPQVIAPHVIAFTVDVGGVGGPAPNPPDPIPPSPDVHYKYVFCDLRTDSFITTLDLNQVSYSRMISAPGSFQATIDVVNDEVADMVAAVVPRWVEHASDPDSLSTGPGRTVCHVYRNGIIWGTYAIWKAAVSSDSEGAIKVSLTGASLESYLNAVEIRSTLTYEGTDQLEIARDLITAMQANTHANIGLTLQSGTSGVLRDRTYAAGETASFGQRLKELADVDDGFEWLIHTSDPGVGARAKLVKFGYPRLGTQTDHVFSQPGNVLSWSQEIDGLRGATSYRARGESVSTDASTASTPLMSSPADATAHLTAGWPRIDRTVDYSTVKEVATLDAYAQRWVTERPGAVRIHQVDVRLDDTEWTPESLGDYARVILSNDWWPIRNGGATFNNRWRVIGVSVRATSRNSQEQATLTFEEEVDI
ncbi:hypothetical protein ACFXJ8_25960 [Nonomuraea sp. NPDC059194]|uniref:hypothetical protein n=1 Tax=Nonomuraea sp. NPDC059194 TaxID=3346764 RepID=UPI0036811B93